MRGFLIVMTLVLGLGQADAQEVAPDPAITGVIQNQIDAFLIDDFETAFTFAAPNIKRMFETPERFGTMVREGYPMVWRPGDVTFLELRERDGALWQKVMVRDAGGAFHVLDYRMVQTGDGWQISAVQLLPGAEVGA